MTPSPHRWRFFSAGGFDQVRLDTGADLVHLSELDQKLWVALSCPTAGLELDERTLALIDSDADGHVRAPELIAAIDWATARLKTPDTLIAGGPLALDAIDDGSDEGARLLASARHVLDSLGKAGADTISVDDTADSVRIFAGMPFNGDGVNAPGRARRGPAVGDRRHRRAERRPADRSGGPASTRPASTASSTMPPRSPRGAPHRPPTRRCCRVGAATADGHAAFAAVRAKIDDFFTRCRLPPSTRAPASC
jgi:hypothetical protein